MIDAMYREVKLGDIVVFNHPNYSLLESSLVQEITPVGVKVIYHNPDETISETIIPEKQFVIIRNVSNKNEVL